MNIEKLKEVMKEEWLSIDVSLDGKTVCTILGIIVGGKFLNNFFKKK